MRLDKLKIWLVFNSLEAMKKYIMPLKVYFNKLKYLTMLKWECKVNLTDVHKIIVTMTCNMKVSFFLRINTYNFMHLHRKNFIIHIILLNRWNLPIKSAASATHRVFMHLLTHIIYLLTHFNIWAEKKKSSVN